MRRYRYRNNSDQPRLQSFEVDSRGLALLGVPLFVVGYLLSVVQTIQTSLFDCRNVNEDIAATVIRRDEPITLGAVEPLYSAVRHLVFPIIKITHAPIYHIMFR